MAVGAATSAYYVALGSFEADGGGTEEGLLAGPAVDLGLMLGDTSFRAELLELAERLEERLEATREADPRLVAAAEGGAGPSEAAEAMARAARSPPASLAGSAVAHLPQRAHGGVAPGGALRRDARLAHTTRPWSDLAYLKRAAGRTVRSSGGALLVADFTSSR